MGNALFNLGRYEQVLAIAPDKLEAWYNRGLVLTYLQRCQNAIALYDQALLITPNNRKVWYDKACCDG
ncbi:tetratricopeptide repeat protein [Calothrix sp. FACHB-156]|nr:tetratricopeptide repeat protein [Calothrix sp. FACHB-156]